MKTLAVVIVAVLGFVAGIIAFLPATLADRRIDAATAGKLRLVDASGTLWDGRGVLTSPGSSWRLPLAFTISKADVVRGVHQVTLRPVEGATSPQAVVEAVGDGVRLRDVAIDIPASALAAAFPGGFAVAGGTLSVSSAAFEWNGNAKSGGVDARWRGARLIVAGIVANLGNVELNVAPRDGRLDGRLAGSGGDVRIDGTISLADNGAMAVDAAIAPAASAPATVALALAALGTPDANGTVRIAWRGALR